MPSSSKCDWNDARQRCEFEISPIRMPCSGQLAENAGHVVVELEMMIRGPLRVNFSRAGRQRVAAPAHLLDDPRRIAHEQLVVVDRLVGPSSSGAAAATAASNRRRIDLDEVLRAKRLVALATKRRAGEDQREVDVEEDDTRRRGKRWHRRHL